MLNKIKRLRQNYLCSPWLAPRNHEDLNEFEKFHLNGYAMVDLPDTQTNKHLCEILTTLLHSKELRQPFYWDEKYKGALDLRPEAVHYDKTILEFLIQNKVLQRLKILTGYDLAVSSIKIRKSKYGIAYLGWHRDTYMYGGQMVGNFPQVYKTIYYPTLGLRTTPQLKIVLGSHRRTSSNKFIDKLQVNNTNTITINSDDKKLVIFDSSVFHAVVKDSNPEGSIRFVSGFCHPYQLAQSKVATDFQRVYEEHLNSGAQSQESTKTSLE